MENYYFHSQKYFIITIRFGNFDPQIIVKNFLRLSLSPDLRRIFILLIHNMTIFVNKKFMQYN